MLSTELLTAKTSGSGSKAQFLAGVLNLSVHGDQWHTYRSYGKPQPEGRVTPGVLPALPLPLPLPALDQVVTLVINEQVKTQPASNQAEIKVNAVHLTVKVPVPLVGTLRSQTLCCPTQSLTSVVRKYLSTCAATAPTDSHGANRLAQDGQERPGLRGVDSGMPS